MSNKRKFEETSNDIELLFFFSKEMDVLSEELDDMKSLYTELKTHYDKVKASKSYGVLEFLSNQTKNLISLKMAIISLIKETANIKRMAKEIEIKSKSGDNIADNAVLRTLITMFKNNSEEILPLEKQENVSLEYRKEDDMDDVLEKRIASKYKDKKEIDLEKLGYRIVFDDDKNQYILDSEDQLVSDVHVKKIEVKFKKSKKTELYHYI